LLFPIRLVFLPFELLMRWIYRPEKHENEIAAPSGLLPATGYWAMKTLKSIVYLPILLLKSPFIVFRELSVGSRIDLLFVIPSLLMFCFFGFVFSQVFIRGKSIETRYRAGAYRAIQDKDYPLAQTYFNRLRLDGILSDSDRLNWVFTLANTGEGEKASQILDELAPDDAIGFGPAHRAKAVNLSARIGQSKDPLTLRKLKHHLDNSQETSEQIDRAWAVYYLAVDETEKALGYLKNASESNPEFLLLIANINESKGRTGQRNTALRAAETAYRELVLKDPLDVKSRVTLAKVLSQLENYAEAERTLLTGLRLQPEPVIKRATADFFVLQHDLSAKRKDGFGRQFAFLQNALALDENYVAVYQRLIALYQKQPDSEEATSIKKQLLDSVTSDRPSSMAHFALSNVLWMEDEKDKAEWHLEQAYNLDKNFTVIVNNLAWMLAHRKNPDLDRALELAETALSKSPNDSRFLDTQATILMKQGNFQDAVTQFQKALPNSKVSKNIHRNLAICFRKLGRDDLAEQHERNASENANENTSR
jgi:tetratricopeptide (TPR) repeat protein